MNKTKRSPLTLRRSTVRTLQSAQLENAVGGKMRLTTTNSCDNDECESRNDRCEG
jgi:hypothetical protein